MLFFSSNAVSSTAGSPGFASPALPPLLLWCSLLLLVKAVPSAGRGLSRLRRFFLPLPPLLPLPPVPSSSLSSS